jgi:hypothetical protein
MNVQKWIDLNGRVVCNGHLGGYGSAALARRPKSKRITTTITVWELLSSDEALSCEDCDFFGKSKENA